MTNEQNEPGALSPEERAAEQAKRVETAVARRTPPSVAIAPVGEDAEEKLAIMREALGEDTLTLRDFEVVKTPAGGGKNWETPEGDAVKELEGVIIYRQHSRAFWKEKFGRGETPQPDCVAANVPGPQAGTGIGDNGQGPGEHDCATCPMAQFGSATNEKGEPMAGQACQLRTRLFMYPKGGDSMLPMIISLGPSAYKEARKYIVGRLGARGIAPHTVVTKIGLNQEQSRKGNITYSVPVFSMGEKLDPQSAQQMDRIKTDMTTLLESIAGRVLEGEFDEYESED